MLEFNLTEQRGVKLLALRGRLDALTAPELRPTIEGMVKDRQAYVVCDLQHLEMVDSSGVGAIVSLFKRLRILGGDVKVACLGGQPKEIFRLLRLDRVFEVYENKEDAISSCLK